jgi:transcriptional regulator with PAS, ATPase and Fis domain
VVLLECDRPLAGAARFSLQGIEQVTVGRGDTRSAVRREEGGAGALDLRLPGRALSASHARLLRVGNSWAIEDLRSRNGTFVEGSRVSRAVLSAGAVFEVGHTLMRVTSVVAPADALHDLDAENDESIATLDPMLAAEMASLAKIAPSRIPVLLLGDSGTGKEVVARRIHAAAGRDGPFVAVNCGALIAALVESQLFGHLKGAFSGATRNHDGFVRAASGGTLLLDEIADLPAESQAALLRVLQEGEVVPVGATRPVPVDARLVAATHRPLEGMVARGTFRQDLYARISGFVVRLAPLRERLDDLGLLVASVLRKVAGQRAAAVALTPEAGRALLTYGWPLNIRELEQTLAVAFALAESGTIEPEHLPPAVTRTPQAAKPEGCDALDGLDERDQRLRLDLLACMAEHRGNLANVARSMGKARTQIQRWCKRFGINPNFYRSQA